MSLEKLTSATGLDRQQLQQIWADVKANSARRNACARHRFDIALDDKPLGGKWRCSACGGTVDAIARSWYQLGLQHGGA